MPNKCVVVGCNTDHKKGKKKTREIIRISSNDKCQMVKLCKQG